jgi:hypothetical protein
VVADQVVEVADQVVEVADQVVQVVLLRCHSSSYFNISRRMENGFSQI